MKLLGPVPGPAVDPDKQKVLQVSRSPCDLRNCLRLHKSSSKIARPQFFGAKLDVFLSNLPKGKASIFICLHSRAFTHFQSTNLQFSNCLASAGHYLYFAKLTP